MQAVTKSKRIFCFHVLDPDVKEAPTFFRRYDIPLFRALVPVDADVFAFDRRCREVANDKCHMSRTADHGVRSIQVALPDAAGMNVDIGNDADLPLFANLPEFSKVTPVKKDDSRVEAPGVEIVIQDEVNDASASVKTLTQKKRATFSRAVSAAFSKAFEEPPPQTPRT